MVYRAIKLYFAVAIFLSALTFATIFVVYKPIVSLFGWEYALSTMQTFWKAKDWSNAPESLLNGVYSNIVRQHKPLDIMLKQKNKNLLAEHQKARMRGSDTTDYVRARIRFSGDAADVGIRVKGDRNIHFRDPLKVSYRVKTKKRGVINGMAKFSIHHPGARNYVAEYIYMLASVDVGLIVPKYDFVDVRINGAPHGVYALEEYPSKYTLERSNRREGPIYRFEEGAGSFHTEVISRVKDISTKGVKTNLNATGMAALQAFREGLRTVDETFDSELLGRQYAVASVFAAQHSLVSKSVRFYYNPMTLKFEPIPFDGHPMVDIPIVLASSLGAGFAEDWTNTPSADWFQLLWRRGGNARFVEAYLRTLQEVSSVSWIKAFLSKHDNEIDAALNAIYSDFPGVDYIWHYGPAPYYWSDQWLFKRAEKIRESFSDKVVLFREDNSSSIAVVNESRLPQIVTGSNCQNAVELIVPPAHADSGSVSLTPAENCGAYTGYNGVEYVVDGNVAEAYSGNAVPKFPLYFKAGLYLFQENGRLLAASQGDLADTIVSAQCDGEELLASETTLGPSKITRFGDQWSLHEIPLVQGVSLEGACKFLRVTNQDGGNRSVAVNEYSSPGLAFDGTYAEMKNVLTHPSFIELDGVISPANNRTTLTRSLFIPSGLKFHVPSGYVIDLQNGAFIHSESPVQIGSGNGPKSVVTSTDSTGRGLSVFSYEASDVSNVTFSNLAAVAAEDWPISGSVSFTKGHVKIRDVDITGSMSEDALNIVDSHVDIAKLTIRNAFSDAFDCDFCTGSISESSVVNAGNDGFDFSGSDLLITDTSVEEVGDKGFSVGERSKVIVSRAKISGAKTCIASKDSSRATLVSVDLSGCEVQLSAYRKKPEFSGGVIEYSDSQITEKVEADPVSSIREKCLLCW